MVETISTKYGTFNVRKPIGTSVCGGCYFNGPTGRCKKPDDFEHRCTTPDDCIFQLVSEPRVLSPDGKYYLVENTSCEGCDLYSEGDCVRPSNYPLCTTTDTRKSSIFKRVNPEEEECPVPVAVKGTGRTRVGMKWDLKDGDNYVIAAKAHSHNGCEGCCFEDDCKVDEDLLGEPVDCSEPDDDEIIFLLNGKSGNRYIRSGSAHEDIIGDLFMIKQEGLVMAARETHRCDGCWFYRNMNCDKYDWMDDSDFPDDCDQIIFTLNSEPNHDDPDWDGEDDDKPIIDEDECEITEVVSEKSKKESQTFTTKDGVKLIYVKERSKNSCKGCYFKRNNCNYSSIGVGDHGGLILVEDSPIKCGDGIMAQIREPNEIKFSLDIGLDSVYKPTPNMSLKKEKKFSI